MHNEISNKRSFKWKRPANVVRPKEIVRLKFQLALRSGSIETLYTLTHKLACENRHCVKVLLSWCCCCCCLNYGIQIETNTKEINTSIVGKWVNKFSLFLWMKCWNANDDAHCLAAITLFLCVPPHTQKEMAHYYENDWK